MENVDNNQYENIENEEQENDRQINTITEQNTTMVNNQSENTANEEQINNTMQENIVLENTTVDLQNEKLEQIHEDLGVICSFLIIFALVIVFKYIYKFFNMFF